MNPLTPTETSRTNDGTWVIALGAVIASVEGLVPDGVTVVALLQHNCQNSLNIIVFLQKIHEMVPANPWQNSRYSNIQTRV